MSKDLEHCTEFDHQKSLYEARHAEPKGPPMGLQNRLEELRGFDLDGKVEGIRRWANFGMVDLVTGLVISKELAVPEETARELLADAFTVQANKYRLKIASLIHAKEAEKKAKEKEWEETAKESLESAARLRRNDAHEVAEPPMLPQPAQFPPRRKILGIFG